MTHLTLPEIKASISMNIEKMNKMLNSKQFSQSEFTRLSNETKSLQLYLK